MAFAGGSGKGLKNDINVTPLVDVVLVLLIIFMVITPMLQRGKDVKLPKANHPEEDNKQGGDPLILSITPDKVIWLESKSIEEDQLEESIVAELTRNPGRKMMLKGDEKLLVGEVRKVMDHAKKAGAKGMELAVEASK